MANFLTLKFQRFPFILAISLLSSSICYCPKSLAAQDAMVLVERAIIYSDKDMTSPIGYISRGKKIVVGEVPRNRAQVYPIVVSGKVAYIRVVDVTTEKESMDATRLTAERFQKTAHPHPESKVVVSYFAYDSQISQDVQNGTVTDGDALFWHGFSLKGEVLMKKSFDLQIITNYLFTTEGEEAYRSVEFGAGLGVRLINKKRFLARLEGQFLTVPFSTYSLGSDFRIKSYGYTLGAGLNLTYLMGEHWGLEGFIGRYYTKLFSFDVPSPYQDTAPSFNGNRLGIGFNYTF